MSYALGSLLILYYGTGVPAISGNDDFLLLDGTSFLLLDAGNFLLLELP